MEKYQFSTLPESSVSFQSAEHLPILNHVYVPRAGSLERLVSENFNAGGLAILDDVPFELGSNDLRSADYREALFAVLESEKLALPFVFDFGLFSVRALGRKVGVGNIYAAPFAFVRTEGTPIRIKTHLLRYMVEQSRLAREALSRRYRQFVKETPNVSPPQELGEPSVVVGEDDEQVISSMLDCYRLSKLTVSSIKIYRNSDEVFLELLRQYPSYSAFIAQLQDYSRALKVGNYLYVNNLPSNFFGFMVQFFLALLGEIGLPDVEELNKRLTLSVCICTKDRPAMLEELLKSIARQTRRPDQLVIVDNSRMPETKGVVDKFKTDLPIVYLLEQAASLPALRNRAIELSTGEILCFTDDDCVLDQHWLSNVERSFLRSNEIGAVGGLVRHLNNLPASPIELFYREYLGQGFEC